MIDFEKKIISWKFTWITRAITNPKSSWKIIVDSLLPDLSFDYLIKCKICYGDLKLAIPKCYIEILEKWSGLYSHEPKPSMIYWDKIYGITNT